MQRACLARDDFRVRLESLRPAVLGVTNPCVGSSCPNKQARKKKRLSGLSLASRLKLPGSARVYLGSEDRFESPARLLPPAASPQSNGARQVRHGGQFSCWNSETT